VRVFEIVMVCLLTFAGLRSLWVWSRRGFEGTDLVDHLLFALYVTGRAGLWFSLAGFFALSASLNAQGRAAVDVLAPYRWYWMVPLLLATMQFVAGWFLGRRVPAGPAGREPAGPSDSD
jgi:hypothetical protein